MDRHEAYKLLTSILADFRSRPFHELEALVDRRVSERVATASGEEFLIDVAADWADERARLLRITASADSPSTFKLERIEEHIMVSGGTT